MNNFKNFITVVSLIVVLMIGTSTASAGFLTNDLKGSDSTAPCTETQKDTKTDWGIVITGFTGIVITGFTGIVITGAADTPVDCGILMSD